MVGKKVMAAAAETLTPVVLELGGKDAVIVAEDANLDEVGVGGREWGRSARWGEVCVCARARVCVCMRVCECVCVCVLVAQ